MLPILDVSVEISLCAILIQIEHQVNGKALCSSRKQIVRSVSRHLMLSAIVRVDDLVERLTPRAIHPNFRFFRSGSVRTIDGSSSQLVHSLECGRGWCMTWKRRTVFAVDGSHCTQILALDHIPAGNPNRGVKSL